MNDPKRFFRVVTMLISIAAMALLLSQCSDTVAPDPAARISVDSGNFQYSRRGTTLPQSFVVDVRTEGGAIPENASVVFIVEEGEGTLSEISVMVDNQGKASTQYTLGDTLGTQIVRAAIKDNESKSVLFEATSSNYFCPEQEEIMRVTYESEDPLFNDLFLATQKSSLYLGPGNSGVVRATPSSITVTRFAQIIGDLIFDSTIYDVAFSARGDFYVARRSFVPEILKIDLQGNVSTFALLDEYLPGNELFVELDTNPAGLLVGCDVTGPFIVGCRDSILRFPDHAQFVDGGINNDALAVDPRRQSEDPLGEDIYFIDKTLPRLVRLSMDSLTVEPSGLVSVATLSQDQADNARGMVCTPDGTVYILVDSDETKELLEYKTDGTLSVIYDFFDRGPGDAAGQQRDLAYDPSIRFLWTLDTLNDDILAFSLNEMNLGEMYENAGADSLTRSALSIRGTDGTLIGGERVGLIVLREL